MMRRPLPKMLVVPDPDPPPAPTSQPASAAAAAPTLPSQGDRDITSVFETVAEVIAGKRPRPAPGADADEAWRLGWTSRSLSPSSSSKKQPLPAAPSGPTSDPPIKNVEGEEATVSSLPPAWPRQTVAAVMQPAVLPAPVFGPPPPSVPPLSVPGTHASATPSTPRPSEVAAKLVAAAKGGIPAVPRNPGGPSMRVYLFMDDELAVKVQQVRVGSTPGDLRRYR